MSVHSTRAVISDLRSVPVAGEVITAADQPYEQVRRVWNGMIDRRPLAVIRAAGVNDIPAVISLAQARGLPLAIRGGGHSVAGHGTVDGGLVLDLGALRAVEVDSGRRVVRVQPGATLADVDRAAQAHGLAVPLGVVSGTGVAGLTLGGGIGWLTRQHGLTADNLLAADVVTASGRTVRASQTENPDLFWGIRGGGGNFGVVSSFTFRAHPLGPEVFAGTLVYRQDGWAASLAAYDAWTRDLPDALGSIVSFIVPPDGWDTLMLLAFAWAGPDRAEGRRVVARMKQAAPPDAEVIDPTRWVAWQSSVDELFPRGVRAYWKNLSFGQLDGTVPQILVRRAAEQRWRGTGFDVHHMGGAFGRVPQDATPFPGRAARYWLNIYGYWDDPADDQARTAFIRGLAAEMEPFAACGRYVNFMAGDDDAQPSPYEPRTSERLAALKARYDPANTFRVNHNITART